MKKTQRIAIGVGVVGVGAGLAWWALRKPAPVAKKESSQSGGGGGGGGGGWSGGGAGQGDLAQKQLQAQQIKRMTQWTEGLPKGSPTQDATACAFGAGPPIAVPGAPPVYMCSGAPAGYSVPHQEQCASGQAGFSPPGVPLVICV